MLTINTLTDPERQHLRNYQASYQTSCSTRWCQAYLWTHLRRDPRMPQAFPWKCHPWLSHLHWTRQAKDCYISRCCLRTQETRTNPLRIWCLNKYTYSSSLSISYTFALDYTVFHYFCTSYKVWLCCSCLYYTTTLTIDMIGVYVLLPYLFFIVCLFVCAIRWNWVRMMGGATWLRITSFFTIPSWWRAFSHLCVYRLMLQPYIFIFYHHMSYKELAQWSSPSLDMGKPHDCRL